LPVQIIVFLLFIGAEKLVNRIAKRPLMNGAAWYLVAAPIMFVIALVHGNSVIAARAEEGVRDSAMHGRLWGSLVGSLIGTFILPVGAAIYYARKFSREKEAAIRDASESTA
jgi:uncharacterized membrane protein